MYLFVIEAGGLRQLARIHPLQHDQFLHDLDELLARSGYRRERREGDLLFFSGKPLWSIDTAILVETIRSLTGFFHDWADHLLGFTIIIDHRDQEEWNPEMPLLDRNLRDARIADSVYLTAAALRSLEPVVTVEQTRSLFRILSFTGEQSFPVALYHDAVVHEAQRDRLANVLQTGTGANSRWIWVHGGDRAVMTATVHTAVGVVGVGSIRVQCYPGMTRSAFLHRVIRTLPALPAGSLTASDPGEEVISIPEILRQSLRDPATRYLSHDHARGELELVAADMLRCFYQTDSPRVLHIADHDLSEVATEDVLSWFPETITVGAVVFSSSTAPPNDDWLDMPFDSAGEGSFNEALRYWNRCCGRDETMPESLSSEATGSFLQEYLSGAQRQVLFLTARTEGLLDDGVLDRFFPVVGIGAADRSLVDGALERLGLVFRQDSLQVHPAVYGMLEHLLEHRERTGLEKQFARFVREEQRSGGITPIPALWSIIAGGLSRRERHQVFHRVVHTLAIHDPEALYDGGVPGNEEYRDSVYSARIRASVRGSLGFAGRREEADHLQGLLRHRAVPSEPRRDYALTLAEYELARRNYVGALDYCKQAVMVLQDETDTDSLSGLDPAEDHLLMARIFFSQRRLQDASHHLAFAREESRGEPRTRLVAAMLEALRLFLVGNLTRAAGEIGDLSWSLLSAGLFEWAMLAWLTTARISFELGEYGRAREEFGFLLNYCRSTGREDPARVALAWMHRAELYSAPWGPDPNEVFSSMEQTPEVQFFRAEAHCRSGRFREALPLLEASIAAERSQNRWPRLGVSWDNGFASVEDLIVADHAGTGTLQRLATAYHAWCLAETGSMDEAVPLFFELTRGNGGIGDDPYASLYNYLYSRVLPRDRVADRDDKLTVLGKAVKLVQERTSRIEEYRDKIRFLQSNAWNRELMTAGQTNNLVSMPRIGVDRGASSVDTNEDDWL